VDPDHLAGQSRRRLAANVAVRDSQVGNIDEARQHSHKMAQRRAAEMESFRLIDSIRESEARTARRSLLSARSSWLTTMEGHQSKSEQSLREAVRETARECVRKEELKKRKAAARQATELANKRAEEFVFQAKEARKFQDMKTRQEQEWLQRKIDFEDLRLKRQLSNDFERVAEREQGEARRRAEHERLQEERAARAKQKEDIKLAEKLKAEVAEEEKLKADAKRRKEKEELRANVAANKAEELCRHSEQVWIQAQAVAACTEAEVEDMRKRSSMLDAEPSRVVLDRLIKRLERTQARAKHARELYERNAQAAKSASQGRKLWLSGDL